MTKPSLRQRIIPSLFAILFAASGWALADPPSRVARLAYVSGAASFSPGGERDWGRAVVNRPMITGDRLWVDDGARAELQLGAAAIRVGGATSITLLNLDDRIAQVQLSQGVLNIRVRQLQQGSTFEVATPNLAYSIRRPGSYRIEVSPDGRTTTVAVRTGLAEVYGDRRAFIVNAGQTFRFLGSGLRDYQTFAVYRPDEFDNWSALRDRRWDTSPSRRYVSPEMIGYEDLDQYGTWRKVPTYGNVWVPRRVAADWAPYRDGHWSWVEPWGWTWIDDQPWGFAPSHYGRWARIDTGWAWVPGPATVRPVYAPALVAFVGGDNVRASGGNAVAWFPLGPRDVYRPSYSVSREYFTSVNTSNTVVYNRSNITTLYDNRDTSNITYTNQSIPGAVVAVLAAAFAQSRPVARETVTVPREMIASAPARTHAPVAPVQASVIGAGAPAAKPPEAVQTRPVVAQVKPPPPPVPFEARRSALAANAGKPLDTAAIAALKPAAPAPAPAVTVVAPEKAVAAPPRPASAPMAALPASAAQAPAPAATPAVPVPPPVVQAPAASQPVAPGREGRASGPRERPAPAASAPMAAPAAAPAPAPAAAPAPTTAPVTAPPPAASAPSPRDRRDQRGEQRREERPAPRQEPAAAAPVPAPAPAPATAAPPAASAPSPRDRREQRREERPALRQEPAAVTPAPAPAQPRPPAPAVPATPATPAAPAARAAASASPPGTPVTGEPRGGRARPPAATASERREAASEARDERRKRQDEEQGRKP